jgi:hypothetical protein
VTFTGRREIHTAANLRVVPLKKQESHVCKQHKAELSWRKLHSGNNLCFLISAEPYWLALMVACSSLHEKDAHSQPTISIDPHQANPQPIIPRSSTPSL